MTDDDDADHGIPGDECRAGTCDCAGDDTGMPRVTSVGRRYTSMDDYRAAHADTHIVADDSADPEHVDDCPGCEADDRDFSERGFPTYTDTPSRPVPHLNDPYPPTTVTFNLPGPDDRAAFLRNTKAAIEAAVPDITVVFYAKKKPPQVPVEVNLFLPGGCECAPATGVYPNGVCDRSAVPHPHVPNGDGKPVCVPDPWPTDAEEDARTGNTYSRGCSCSVNGPNMCDYCTAYVESRHLWEATPAAVEEVDTHEHGAGPCEPCGQPGLADRTDFDNMPSAGDFYAARKRAACRRECGANPMDCPGMINGKCMAPKTEKESDLDHGTGILATLKRWFGRRSYDPGGGPG